MKNMITAVAASLIVLGSASAAITIASTNIGNNQALRTGSMAVQAGDVVVMISAVNQNPTRYMNFTTTAPDTFTRANSYAPGFTGVVQNTWISYATMTTAGTYDFSAQLLESSDDTQADGNPITGLYLLSSDAGHAIEFLDYDFVLPGNILEGNTQTFTNSLDWSGTQTGDVALFGGGSHFRGPSPLTTNISATADETTADGTGLTNDRYYYTGVNTDGNLTGFDVDWELTQTARGALNGSVGAAAFGEVIPEPTTFAMAALMGLGTLLVRRR